MTMMNKPTLLVMRLADMHRVHPQQITAKCARCNEVVAIYPSGQRMMRGVPGGIELVCSHCWRGPINLPDAEDLDELRERMRQFLSP